MDAWIDGDIIVYKAAAATNGTEYVLSYRGGTYSSHSKKALNDICKQLGISNSFIKESANPEPLTNCLGIVKRKLGSIERALVERFGDIDMYCVLSGDKNFRYGIDPNYKANRKDKPKPFHLEKAREYIVKHHGAIVTDGIECDDYLSIMQRADPDNSVICTTDKDLLQVPGFHYNFDMKEFTEVSEVAGLRNLYRQVLVGDTADHIFGVKGIGPVKASTMIDHLVTEEDMYGVCLEQYHKHGPDNYLNVLSKNISLLKLLEEFPDDTDA